MRIVVTGGAGFIGAAVCRHLVTACGHSVLALDKVETGAGASRLSSIAYHPGFTFRRADVCDRGRTRSLLDAYEPDAVIHLARQSEDWLGTSGGYIRDNVVGTFGLLEAVRDHWSALTGTRRNRFRLLQVSTASVFGKHHDGTVAGTGSYRPDTPFAASMAAADQLVLAWHRSFGLPALIVAPTDIYGPYQCPDRDIARWIIAAVSGDGIDAADAQPTSFSEPLHSEDCAVALEALVRSGAPGTVYPLSGGNVRSAGHIAGKLIEFVERHRSRSAETRLAGNGRTAAAGDCKATPPPLDCSLAERDAGWRPSRTLDAGLSLAVRWYLDNEHWWRSVTEARAEGARHGLLLRA